mgnify:CR=1 FL=1
MQHCFCVLGWYFYPDFYNQLYQIPGEKYIVSHRDQAFVEAQNGVFDMVKKDVIYGENKGLEWGGYHRFVDSGNHEKYDFVIFTHDDIVLKSPVFVEKFREMFQTDPKLKVIGNGKNGKDWEFKFGKYKDRMFFKDDDDFVVRTVRGSFFAARTDIFPVIGNFPVRWKTQTPKKGNISLRNFGYVISKNFGTESIAYLDDARWLDTEFVSEMVRGA